MEKNFYIHSILYQYHKAPKDYNRYTLDFFKEISNKNNLKIHYQNALGTGPFFSIILYSYMGY